MSKALNYSSLALSGMNHLSSYLCLLTSTSRSIRCIGIFGFFGFLLDLICAPVATLCTGMSFEFLALHKGAHSTYSPEKACDRFHEVLLKVALGWADSYSFILAALGDGRSPTINP